MTKPPPNRLEQLRRAFEAGLIDRDTYDAAKTAMSAQAGGVAIAEGAEAVAVGPGGVAVQGGNDGTINLGVMIQQGTRAGASERDLTRAYLARILTQADQLPLFIGDGSKAHIRLSSVYTALLTQRGEAEIAFEDGDVRGKVQISTDRDKRLSALEVLDAEARLVLLGGPGSGKSTFVSFVALSMAGELLGLPELNLETLTAPLPKEEDDEEDPPPQRWEQGPLLPVSVVLRDFASQLPAPGTPANAETLWAFIEGQLRQAALGDFAPLLKRRLHESGGLVLLDGLDEVPDARDRRARLVGVLQRAARAARSQRQGCGRAYAPSRGTGLRRAGWRGWYGVRHRRSAPSAGSSGRDRVPRR